MFDKAVRQFLRTRAALLAIAFLVAACAFGLLVQLAPWRDSFDPIAWADQAVEDRDRQEMADDLIARRLLDGLTRPEVTALLGEPPETAYFREWDLVYRLGMERNFISIDSEWLVVRFGEDGRVSEHRIVTD